MVRFLVAAAWMLALGCERGPKAPEEAFLKLEAAVAAGDGAKLYECLDRATRRHIDGAFHDQELARTIIAAKYPEAEARAALAQLEAAAEPDVERYFAHRARADKLFEEYRRRLGSVSGPLDKREDGQTAWVGRRDGAPFQFVHGKDGWRFGELLARWTLEHDRAQHAVQTVRENARLYTEAK